MQLSSVLFGVGILAVSFGVLAGCRSTFSKPAPLKLSTISMNGKTYQIELAETPAQQVQGLSDRDQLGSDGMLFIFPEESKQVFWMKDMKFDLDFIWIKDGIVTEITPQVKKPEPNAELSALPRYSPQTAVDMMLEVNAGFAEKEGIKVGDIVGFEK